MSMTIKQAVNQVRLTNVAIVRMKRNGKRFEVACYKNKVVNWRNGVETDIDEVLQIDRVFHNVSKGVVANSKELQEAFGTSEQEAVCRIILEKGEFQVSDKERDAQFQSTFRDIATIVTEKSINPQTGRPYPPSTIEAAMRNTIHYAVVPSKSAKQQALEVIRQLKAVIPLERAKMRLKIGLAQAAPRAVAEIRERLASLHAAVEKDQLEGEAPRSVQVLVDPGHYRVLDEFIAGIPGGSLEVQEFSVQKEQQEVDVAVDHGGTVGPAGSREDVPGKQDSAAQQSQAAAGPVKDTPLDAYDHVVSSMNRKKLDKKKRKKQERRAAAAARQVASAVATVESSGGDDSGARATDEALAGLREADVGVQVAASAALGLAQELAQAQIRGETPETAGGEVGTEGTNQIRKNQAVAATAGAGLKCSTCQVSFGTDRSMQSAHYRSDIHRMNLKLKSKKLPPVTQEEFEFMGPDEIDAIMHDYRVD